MTKGIPHLTFALLGVLLLSGLGAAQKSWPSAPPKPSYTPPPKPAYTPPARTYSPPPVRPSQPATTYRPPAQPSYRTPNSPSSTYTPPPSTPAHTYTPGTSAHTYTPGTSSSVPARTYTPGTKATNEAPASSSSGITTFTPHAGGSGASWTSSHSEGATGVTSNGVTTFTPHASGATYTPAASTYSGTKISGVSATEVNAKPRGPVYSVPSTAVASKMGNGNSVLTPTGSTHVVHDVNSARAGLSGINRRPIPPGQVTAHANGNITVKAAEGRQYGLRQDGTLASFQKPGLHATFAPNGHINSLHTNTLAIRGFGTGRTIVLHRGGALIVSSGPHAGYVQRTVPNNGVAYVQRTYVSGTTVYTRTFTPFTYHGALLTSYVPAFYYPAPFYGWAYYPWAAAVAYQWGWADDSWYGYYGPYFAVSPFYTGPNFWLTDYFLGQVLSDAYQARMEEQAAADEDQQAADDQAAPPDNAGDAQPAAADADTPITPQLKQAIAEEVKQQLAYENAASQAPAQSADLTGLPQVLTPNQIFVENAVISVLTTDGKNYCQLAPGDAVKITDVAADSSVATSKVVASRRGDCPVESVVTLSLDELQEMQNNFREKLDSGLKDLHNEQGQEGLPAAPKSAMADAPHATVNLPPDPDAQAEVTAATTEADQAENSVAKTAFDSTQTAAAKQ